MALLLQKGDVTQKHKHKQLKMSRIHCHWQQLAM